MAKSTQKNKFLAIDGGATKSRAILLDEDGKVLGRSQESACNAALLTDVEMRKVFKAHLKTLGLKKSSKLLLSSICLAGVVNETTVRKVLKAFLGLTATKKIKVTGDLHSALFAGSGSERGIVVISGTGSCVFAKHQKGEAKAGGWGHVLGDVGSGYHIAHKGLRRAIAHYDLYGKLDSLGKALVKQAGVSTVEELSVFVGKGAKSEVARLSRAVFDAYRGGHLPSRMILHDCAGALANNVLAVRRKVRSHYLPVTVAGGIFEVQNEYFKIFSSKLRKHWPEAVIELPEFESAVGAHLWGCYEAGIKFDVQSLPKVQRKKKKTKTKEITLEKLESIIPVKPIDQSTLPTEKRNPYTTELSEVSILDAVGLMIEQDERIVKALEESKQEIAHAVQLIVDAFEEGGRLFYIGAGTSGRLGVLDASECPPTFSVPESMVQGIIAGGMQALSQAVEGAEDSRVDCPQELKRRDLSKHDVVVGIAASGRTPFVLSGLEFANKKKARTIFLTCNPQLRTRPNVEVDCDVHLNSGPESLTGSTRLRAGTLCKMTMNIFTTLAMTKMGKVQSNYMVDVAATNDKLKARAIGMVMTLGKVSKEEAYTSLISQNWSVRNALEELA